MTPADLFLNLRSVNLENNNLTSFSGLVYLPNVTVQSIAAAGAAPPPRVGPGHARLSVVLSPAGSVS